MSTTENCQREMPKYKCHKQVHALKIAEIKEGTDGAMITPADEGFAPFFVNGEYLKKHSPQVGGYYVVYKDGYKSFSPASAFESGYVLTMGRKVTFSSQEHTTVFACDDRGPGNANHLYHIAQSEPSSPLKDTLCQIISFQRGPIKENGVNGIHNEDLLCIVLDRLGGFQAGDFACGENAIAYTYIRTALKCLRLRTEDRKKQGVEGTNTKREVVPTPEEVILRYNKGGIKI